MAMQGDCATSLVSEGAGSGGGNWHAVLRSLQRQGEQQRFQHQQHSFSLVRALIVMGVAFSLLVM
jgi:hypothetical protein